MILTLTPNTAFDRTVVVSNLKLGRNNRIKDRWMSPTGKGVDVSKVLHELGVPTCAMGFAAGETGRQLDAALRAVGVPTQFVWVDGETRLNIVIISEDGVGHTTLSDDSLIVSEAHQQALLSQIEQALPNAKCLTLGGSLPRSASPVLYTQVIGLARAHGVPVILDASGPDAHAWLAAGPTWLKPNREELAFLLGHEVRSMDEALRGAQLINKTYGVNVLASLDVDGSIAMTATQSWRIRPLAVPVVSAAGAGDALVAGLASALANGEPIETGLRLGAAAAAATVMRRGTAECKREDVERLLPQVEIKAIERREHRDHKPGFLKKPGL
jgi:1-phosphofructokinase family hexose kinase